MSVSNIRRLYLLFIAVLLAIGTTAVWTETGVAEDETEDAIIDCGHSSSSVDPCRLEDGEAASIKKSKSSKISKVVKAPFRFFNRIFGSHRKVKAKADSSDARIKAPRAKDGPFESAAVMRISIGSSVSEAEALVVETLSKTAGEQLTVGRRLLADGHYREAITLLSKASSSDPSLTEARILLGTAFDLQGASQRASLYYRDALENYSQTASLQEKALVLNNQGYSLYLQGHYKNALKYITQAVELEPANARFLNNMGLVNYRLGRYKDAYQAFARAGGRAHGHLNVAILFERDGRTEDALRYTEAARRDDPNSQLVRERLINLYERTGKEILAARERKLVSDTSASLVAIPD